MTISEYLFESVAARDYLADSLASGDPLSRSLLRIPIHTQGYVSAFLPRGCKGPFTNVKEFSSSLGVGPISSQAAIDRFVWTYLRSNDSATAMFSALALEGDKAIERFETPYVLTPPPAWWRNENRRGVLLIQETSYATQNSVRVACRETRGFPSRFALMSPPSRLGPLPIGGDLDQDRLDALTDFTDHIVLGAFDEESALIWSAKVPKASRYIVSEDQVD